MDFFFGVFCFQVFLRGFLLFVVRKGTKTDAKANDKQ